MMKKILISTVLLGLALPPAAMAAPRLGYITGGVMLHWNFSQDEFKAFSYGLEAAYWSYERDPAEDGWFRNLPNLNKNGYGVDAGLDIDFKNIRVYVEPQVGRALTGLSCGPVLELPKKGGDAHWGLQGSYWVNMLAGFDFRYRRMDGKNFQAVGVSGKMPFLVSGSRDY
jgi:hypothetical protein